MSTNNSVSDDEVQETTPSAPSGVVDLSNAHAPSPELEVEADITDEDGSTANVHEKSFADFGVADHLVSALNDSGITYPFPIQALTLPVALGRQDIIGQAKTGTGKTLGFAIPTLQHVVAPDSDEYDKLLIPGAPQALIVVPTRELAKQVASEFITAASHSKIRVVEIYGGMPFEPQIEALERGVEVVVGTPGRLLDLLKRKVLALNAVHTVVLDEADEMLDLGFLPDVETLLARTPANRHTMLFSATMPGAVVALARRYMTRPTHIRAQDPTDQGATVKSIKQVIYRAHNLNKSEVLTRILQANGRGKTIIFARTKRTCAALAEELAGRGFKVSALHGDLGQGAREKSMVSFRDGTVDVFVATDVAARGLDIDDVTHVINYQCPEDEKIYLHRIGRTGRAGANGTAVTFVDWDDVPRWRLIDKALGLGCPEPVETYHTSEHLYTDLDIPRDAGAKVGEALSVKAGGSRNNNDRNGGRRSSDGRGRNGRRDSSSGGRGRDRRQGEAKREERTEGQKKARPARKRVRKYQQKED
ncbi:DNA helicase [Boudabousia tangfeifanii]|uniref:RNA helicase n=1 Tax=Boudabousia tangfeifanii TaxID=1912795 RepID=A0A1D9MJG4_9ACTO|nr:DEAD/DEAH box helicase [Boudabousia tangfeifanii]AOZ72320.1 DNA helicase [Boudabousia tangfeifanii]